MSSYASATKQPPRTLTAQEQTALLKTTGEHKDGFRDHIIFSIALGTGLREHEILALNYGDLFDPRGKAKPRVQLSVFKRSNDDKEQQEVFLPDTLRYKLEKYFRMRKAAGADVSPESAVFVSREGNRLSARQARHAFAEWQKRAGLTRHFKFHHLRHTALTNLYKATRDIRLVQRQARHKTIVSTTIYAGPDDEAVHQAVRGLPC
jgi:site-specific recombinase XerC